MNRLSLAVTAAAFIGIPVFQNPDLAEMNRVRAAQGLSALAWDDSLAAKAKEHADIVAADRRNRLWHPGGGTEIAARGQTTIAEACGDWMNSRGHRAILTGNYRKVGIASAVGRNGQTVWMAQFE